MGYLLGEGCDGSSDQINASVTLILPAGFPFRACAQKEESLFKAANTGAPPSTSDSLANGCCNSMAGVLEVKVPCRGKSAKSARKPISPRTSLLDLFRVWFGICTIEGDQMHGIGIPLGLDDKEPRAHAESLSLV